MLESFQRLDANQVTVQTFRSPTRPILQRKDAVSMLGYIAENLIP